MWEKKSDTYLSNIHLYMMIKAYIGSYFEMEQVGTSLFIAYTYKFQWLNFYFGLKPLFIFLYKEEKDGRDAFARGNKGEDSSKGLQ